MPVDADYATADIADAADFADVFAFRFFFFFVSLSFFFFASFFIALFRQLIFRCRFDYAIIFAMPLFFAFSISLFISPFYFADIFACPPAACLRSFLLCCFRYTFCCADV